MIPSLPSNANAIVFHDGHCLLCGTFVRLLLWADRRKRLHFAPLQGETARELLPKDARALDTIVFMDAKGAWRRSDAILRILGSLGGPWRMAAFLARGLPRPVRDWIYDLLARNRERVFGRSEVCLPARTEDRERLLP